jgi:gluconate 2-dehydrogenase gamma chain
MSGAFRRQNQNFIEVSIHMRRREFLALPAPTFGGVLLYSLGGKPIRLQAQQGQVLVPMRFFTAEEAKVVSAACERIFPKDESGPGAEEAGVAIYIDRQLAGPYGRDQFRYTKGPWVESVPEHGYQGKATPREIYREGIPHLGAFLEMSPPQRDERLRSIEKTMFFQMLRTHTIEGMFCDPLHGGNVGMVGWQMIGYPGPQMSFRDQIGKTQPIRRKPVSLTQVVGHPVKGWEEER